MPTIDSLFKEMLRAMKNICELDEDECIEYIRSLSVERITDIADFAEKKGIPFKKNRNNKIIAEELSKRFMEIDGVNGATPHLIEDTIDSPEDFMNGLEHKRSEWEKQSADTHKRAIECISTMTQEEACLSLERLLRDTATLKQQTRELETLLEARAKMQ